VDKLNATLLIYDWDSIFKNFQKPIDSVSLSWVPCGVIYAIEGLTGAGTINCIFGIVKDVSVQYINMFVAALPPGKLLINFNFR
jgi:hypothetical protein